MAAVLDRLGVRCGHESVFGIDTVLSGAVPDWRNYQGDSSWLAACSRPAEAEVVFHQTRHPLEVVRSIVGLGLLHDDAESAYTTVIRRHAPEVFLYEETPLRSAALWTTWNERIEERASFRYQAEGVEAAVPEVLRRLNCPVLPGAASAAVNAVSRRTNGRQRDESITWDTIAPVVRALSERYGYLPPP